MKRTVPMLLTLALILALLPAGSAGATGTLDATTTHSLAAPELDGSWVLAWQGDITGDIEGRIEWWLDTDNWTGSDNVVGELPPDPVTYFVGKALVTDPSSGAVLLETRGNGETDMTTSTRWAHSIVTFADPTVLPGWEGTGVIEAGRFDLTTTPPTGTSTFQLTTEPLVIGATLIDATTDEDLGPLWPGSMIDLSTTPAFNIRVDTAPASIGSVGLAVADASGAPVHFRLDRSPVENFVPYTLAGDWPVGNYISTPLGVGSYTMTATPYSGGNRTGIAGPEYTVPFTVGEAFTAAWTGTVLAIDTDPATIADRCAGPAWAVVSFGGGGTNELLGKYTGLAEHCSFIGPLPDGTVGPDGTYGEGRFTMTAENGDLLEGTYDDGVTTAPPPMVEFADVIIFRGGTGMFANASGTGTETGTVDFTMGFVPGASFTVEMEGVISY